MVCVRMFGPAKTVVDCFRFRNKIGFDVALEALRDSTGCAGDVDRLRDCAHQLRAGAVMRPYMESMV